MEIEKVLARSQCLLLGPAFRLDLVYIGRLVKRIRPRLSFGGMLVTKGVKIGPICRHSKANCVCRTPAAGASFDWIANSVPNDTAMKATEHAECERLAHYVNALLPALERFNNFAGPDLAGPRRAK
jgi:hypothetical protein